MLIKAHELYKQGKADLKESLYARGIVGDLANKPMDYIKMSFADAVEDILNIHNTAIGDLKE